MGRADRRCSQLRVSLGGTSLNGLSQTLPALYSLPAGDFNDITSGSNGPYSAGPGYDMVTGIGSPVANELVPGLALSGMTVPVLTDAMTSSAGFQQGGAGSFTVTVSNVGTKATSGTVSAVDTLPVGLTPTAADNGTINGWTLATSGQNVTATRSDALAAGAAIRP